MNNPAALFRADGEGAKSVISVIGVGPGTGDYLTPIAARMLARAGAVVGGKRHIDAFARADQTTFVIRNNLPAAVAFIRRHREQGVVVLASGDPGLYGMLAYLRRHFAPQELCVIPGISAMQLAFARLAMPWHDFVLLSAHGRELKEVIETVRRHPRAALFTDGRSTPAEVARELRAAGVTDRRLYCCCDLGYPEEKIISGTVADFCQLEMGTNNCVLVIADE